MMGHEIHIDWAGPISMEAAKARRYFNNVKRLIEKPSFQKAHEERQKQLLIEGKRNI